MKWQRVFVEDVAKIVTKGTTPTSIGFSFSKEGIPFLRVNNIQDGKINLGDVLFIDSKTDQALARSRILKKDVIISIAGTIGKTAVIPANAPAMNCNQALAIIRLHNNVDPYYFNHWLNTGDAFRQITGSKVTATISNLSLGCIKKLKIPLPPIDEQRRIAAILDQADAIRRKRQQAIALTDELLRSTFLEMFGDPVINPKGWEEVTVNDIVSAVRDGPHVSPKYSQEGIPILSTRNIRPGKLIMEDVKYVSYETYLDLVKRFKPQCGDVLLTKGGTTGFAKTVDWDWPFTIWVHVAVLRPTDKIIPEFLETALNSPNCYEQSQKYTHGIANKDLGLTRIRKIKLSW
ncbi:MAG: restriction endonuclease subunit S [Trichodesmium sp. St15_bin1_1]|jgi:type I restriction enzyme S subunit|nr:restriction endonuclease subunit S [Trichodesmium sp. St15_bin1_1]